jgi:hypothetical protein
MTTRMDTIKLDAISANASGVSEKSNACHSQPHDLLARERGLIPDDVQEFFNSHTTAQPHAWLMQNRENFGVQHSSKKIVASLRRYRSDYFPVIRSAKPSAVLRQAPVGQDPRLSSLPATAWYVQSCVWITIFR